MLSDINRLISRGHYLTAIDRLKVLGDSSYSDRRVQRLLALALLRIGYYHEAVELLKSEFQRDCPDQEILAMLGSAYKQLWLANRRESRNLSQSIRFYKHSYKLSGEYWAGINAATLSLVAGDRSVARSLAERVIDKCWAEYGSRVTQSSVWIPATIAEAFLIRGDIGRARTWYKKAAGHLRGQIGRVKSIRVNADLLLESMDLLDEERCPLEEAIPRVRLSLFVFAGESGKSSLGSATHKRDYLKLKRKIKKKIVEQRVDMAISTLDSLQDHAFLSAFYELKRPYHIVSVRGPDSGYLSEDRPWLVPQTDALVCSAEDTDSISIFPRKQRAESMGRHLHRARLLTGLSLIKGRQFDADFLPIVCCPHSTHTAEAVVSCIKSSGHLPTLIDTPRTRGVRESFSPAGFSRLRVAKHPAVMAVVALSYSLIEEDINSPEGLLGFAGYFQKAVAMFSSEIAEHVICQDSAFIVFRDILTVQKMLKHLSVNAPKRLTAVGRLLARGASNRGSISGVKCLSWEIVDALAIARKLDHGEVYCTQCLLSEMALHGPELFHYSYAGKINLQKSRMQYSLFRIQGEV